MSHSNSSLNTFASCMSKYWHAYINHSPTCKPPSPHLAFGVMAHDVLYKAGILRDEVEDGVVDTEKYYNVIPSEVLYGELKAEFGIQNWYTYFVQVIKQVAEYENRLKSEMLNLGSGNLTIEREVKLQLTVDEQQAVGIYGLKQSIVGIVDLLMYDGVNAYILDYKFSSSQKTQDDFDMNSQLPLYAMLVHYKYDIPLHNIKYGYIDIPKKSFDKPILLKNGTLSRAKSQNVSQDLYKKAVEAVHGDDEYYNCEPGGYYYEAYCNMALNKAAYLSMQYLDMDVYGNVTKDLLDAATMIDKMQIAGIPYLKKYDAYTCKSCEFLTSCKPWLTVNGGE